MTSDLTGQIINDAYRIDSQLADGGMSVVYLATQLSLSRPVVLKVLRANFIDEDFINLFLREARINSQLVHPNVVGVVDFGKTEDGMVYLAMEFLDGLTLDELVSHKGGLPLAQITWVIEQVCAGIQAAHKLNVVHRDLKPNNVMISRLTGDSSTVKVLDFGISKPLSEEDLKHTRLGMVMGTPGFLAPEQIEGRVDIDPRADVYAIGALIYFMASGDKPFNGPTREIILSKQLSDPAPKLDPLEIHDETCLALQPIIDKAMNKDRDIRYPDVMSLWQETALIAQKTCKQRVKTEITEKDEVTRYQFVYTGKLVDDVTINQAKVALVKSFKIDSKSIEKLFGGKRAVVKKNISFEEATKLKDQFLEAGCLGIVEEMQDATRVIQVGNPKQTDATLPSFIEPIRFEGELAKLKPKNQQGTQATQHSFGSSFLSGVEKKNTDKSNKKTPKILIASLCSIVVLIVAVLLTPDLRFIVTDQLMKVTEDYKEPRGVSAKEINIGMTAAFSGSARELGRSMQNGILAYFNKVNKEGGIHGRALKLLSKDDGYEPAAALSNTEVFLSTEPSILAMLGNVGTPTSKAVIPLALENKLMVFGSFTGASLLRKHPPDKYVFNYRNSYENETHSLIHYFVKVKGYPANSIAVFYQNDSFGKDGFTGVVRALEQFGISYDEILTGTYQRNTAMVADAVLEFTPDIPDIKAIIIIGTYSASADFTVKMRDRGYTGDIANVSFVGSKALAERLKEENPDYLKNVIVSQVVPHYNSFSSVMIEYREALNDFAPSENPNFVSAEGYIAAKIFVEGLVRAGRYFSLESLIETFETMDGFDAGTGELISFSPKDHQASEMVWGTQLNAKGEYEEIDLENITIQ